METKQMKEAQLVFNMGVARRLIKRGCEVVDLKPDRENTDKTIVVFKNDEHFRAEFAKINEEIAAAKAAE
jgi:microcystin degradation protein MlrC